MYGTSREKAEYLILACVIIASATSAWAAPSEKKDKPESPKFFLLDSDPRGPKVVGPIIDLDPRFVRVILEERSVTTGEKLLIAPQVDLIDQRFGRSISHSPIFEIADCSSQPYFDSGTNAISYAPFTRAWISSALSETRPALYAATSETKELILRVALLSNGNCLLFNGQTFTDAWPAELIDDDLHFTYPPPYTVDIR
jgi:hypothetical protein